MPPELVPLTEGLSIALDKPILLLGRHQECDIQLNSRKISRRHCCIAQVQDYLVVRDLYSTNGIRVNGKKVLEARLGPGDHISIGNFEYQVVWAEHPNAPSSQVEDHSSHGHKPKPDNPLESSEHPVLLKDLIGDPEPEYQSEPYHSPHSEERRFEGVEREDEPESPRHQESLEDQGPVILPDNIELAPSSHDNLGEQT
ncbi:MAG: FHA domain-containing protein [Gemmataceae bacterium]